MVLTHALLDICHFVFDFAKKNRFIRWAIVIALCLASILPIPLRINTAFYYIIYFYAGYEALIGHSSLGTSLSSKFIPLFWLFFGIFFVALTICNTYLTNICSSDDLILKAIGLTASNMISKIIGFSGIGALLCTSYVYINRKQISGRTIQLGSYCFGVYLFQQFIIVAIYYYSSLPVFVDAKVLPWFVYVVALLLSILLS